MRVGFAAIGQHSDGHRLLVDIEAELHDLESGRNR